MGIETARKLRVVALGTYDKSKPRARILLRGLRENDVEITECHRDVWGATVDKSQVSGLRSKLAIFWNYLIAYPILIFRYLRCSKHDVVLIGYLGLFDVLILWPFIRMRRAVLFWDVFLSLYNTVVEDRKMISRYNPAAIALWAMEWLALRLVDQALMDTQAHADFLRTTYHVGAHKVARIFVGAEPEIFDAGGVDPCVGSPGTGRKTVLFYGQFIPLHGIEYIVRAAKLTEATNLDWMLIGKGQEAKRIHALIEGLAPGNLDWREWVSYETLIEYLARSDVALGIFGSTEKAQRVIPNKVFQILMAGRPLITADTPAARELLSESVLVRFVPAGDAEALAEAALEITNSSLANEQHDEKVLDQILPVTIGSELRKLMSDKLQMRN